MRFSGTCSHQVIISQISLFFKLKTVKSVSNLWAFMEKHTIIYTVAEG